MPQNLTDTFLQQIIFNPLLLQHLQGQWNLLHKVWIMELYKLERNSVNFLQTSGIMADGAQVQLGSFTSQHSFLVFSSLFFVLLAIITYTLTCTIKIQLPWFAQRCSHFYHSWYVSFCCLNSIIGISTLGNLYSKRNFQICTQSNVHPARSTRISCQHCSRHSTPTLSLMKNKLYTLPYTGVFHTRCIFCIIPCRHTHPHTYPQGHARTCARACFTQTYICIWRKNETICSFFTHNVTQILVLTYLMSMSLKNENTMS